MRALLVVAGAALLAACAASTPPVGTSIRGPIVPDNMVASRGGRSLTTPAAPTLTAPDISDRINDIDRQLRDLKASIPPAPPDQ